MAIINLWTWPKNKNDPCKMGRFQKLSDPPRITFFWLGRQDSNLRMLGPKPSALPLGDGPLPLNHYSIIFSF